ncbi:hypothetical protein ABN028_17440 [Actinopolymorpha sp. B17G11]|uniref:hypothetical protein n=1 Tax=Actinopolymorpha sp. B17G11 TaxID=3160861 RepID=UPI0032E3B84F
MTATTDLARSFAGLANVAWISSPVLTGSWNSTGVCGFPTATWCMETSKAATCCCATVLALCAAATAFDILHFQAERDPESLPWVFAGLNHLADDPSNPL